MNTSKAEKFILSVGGSLIVPNTGIDTVFLKKFNKFIRLQVKKHPTFQYFLVTGGGLTCRNYRDAGRAVVGHELSEEEQDWLGIHATRLNAHLMRTIFQDIAHPAIIKDYSIIRKVSEPVIVAAGWKPGFSTDYCSVLLCEDYHVKTVINLSNVDYVYDKDPRFNKNAKPIYSISWVQFRGLVGDEWQPGMHAPFDPIAAKKAEKLGLKVVILNGNNLDNLQNYLSGKKFIGTVIQ